MLSNAEIIDLLIEELELKNVNQLTNYLNDKYGINIRRQQIYELKKRSTSTVTNLLLHTALELLVKKRRPQHY